MKRFAKLAPGLAAVAVLTAAATPAHAEKTLRMATLAPKQSAWGKVLRVFQKAVDKRTDGLKLEIYYNGVQGNEGAMVSKVKSGQLDGAVLTSVGLASINRDVMVLQLPGVVDSWSDLDKARRAVDSELTAGFHKNGFDLLNWGDIGMVRMMSRGFAVRRPADLRGKHPVEYRNSVLGPVVFEVIGGVTAVPLGPMEVLPALRSGRVDVVSAPCLAAEQLQWTPHLDHIGTRASVAAIGGTVMRKGAMDDVPADTRAQFEKLRAKLEKATKKRARRLDQRSYRRVRKKMKRVRLSAAERKEWEKVLRESVERLGRGTLPKPLIEKVLKATGTR